MKSVLFCCCEKCRFVYESVGALARCPDCGSGPIRPATPAERERYAADRRRYGAMPIYSPPRRTSAGRGKRHIQGIGNRE